jgi:hypothetical protein
MLPITVDLSLLRRINRVSFKCIWKLNYELVLLIFTIITVPIFLSHMNFQILGCDRNVNSYGFLLSLDHIYHGSSSSGFNFLRKKHFSLVRKEIN